MSKTVEIPGEYLPLVSALEVKLESALSYWDARYHSVQRALDGWATLIAELGTFDRYVEEYVHELGSRDTLADALEASTWPLRGWLLRTVDELDEMFRVKTDLDRDDLMWGGYVDQPCRWWHRRMPPDADLRGSIHVLAPEMRAHRVARRSD